MPPKIALGLYWTLLAAVALLFVFGALLPDRERLARTRARRLDLMRRTAALKRGNLRLQAGLERLRMGDPTLWEQVIRERLGWVAPGEVPASDSIADAPPRWRTDG